MCVFSTHSWEYEEGWLYPLLCTVLYKGLAHPWIWVLDPIPSEHRATTVAKVLGSQS